MKYYITKIENLLEKGIFTILTSESIKVELLQKINGENPIYERNPKYNQWNQGNSNYLSPKPIQVISNKNSSPDKLRLLYNNLYCITSSVKLNAKRDIWLSYAFSLSCFVYTMIFF